jgi:hypothetical protein
VEKWTGLLVGAAVVVSVALGSVAAQAGDATSSVPTVTPVVTGLNNPRGVAVDAKGNLYVAEAGPYLGSGDEIQHGLTTGRVSKWMHPGAPAQRMAWSTPFDALYDNENGVPEVLGAAGLSAFGNGCMKNSEGERNGCALFVILGESKAGYEAHYPGETAPPQLGHLFKLNPGNGDPADVSDVGGQQYQWTADHSSLWEEFPDANPYGVLVTKGHHSGKARVFVADAGANTISEVEADGSNRVIAYVPNDGVRDSTPTCIAQGPDGALYVGTLNLLKNGFGQNPGQSDVWRIDPDTHEDFIGAAHLWATGLTTVTACAFDEHGNFWATEMFQPNEAGPPGDVVRIPFGHPDKLHRFGGGALPFPGGIAFGPEGGMYVSVNSLTFEPGSGAVVRVALH